MESRFKQRNYLYSCFIFFPFRHIHFIVTFQNISNIFSKYLKRLLMKEKESLLLIEMI